MKIIECKDWDSDFIGASEGMELKLRAYVDGKDVTDRCFEAHPIQGWVLACKVDKFGNPLFSVSTVILKGDVKVFDPDGSEYIPNRRPQEISNQ